MALNTANNDTRVPLIIFYYSSRFHQHFADHANWQRVPVGAQISEVFVGRLLSSKSDQTCGLAIRALDKMCGLKSLCPFRGKMAHQKLAASCLFSLSHIRGIIYLNYSLSLPFKSVILTALQDRVYWSDFKTCKTSPKGYQLPKLKLQL